MLIKKLLKYLFIKIYEHITYKIYSNIFSEKNVKYKYNILVIIVCLLSIYFYLPNTLSL